MKQRRLSRNMQRIQEQRARRDAYLASEKYRLDREAHAARLKDLGFPDSVVARYEAPWEPKRTRVRRGKVVEIPEEWQGVVTHQQTIRKRKSKSPRKLRRVGKPPRPAERAALDVSDVVAGAITLKIRGGR